MFVSAPKMIVFKESRIVMDARYMVPIQDPLKAKGDIPRRM